MTTSRRPKASATAKPRRRTPPHPALRAPAPNPCGYELYLVALALGLLAVLAGADVLPVVLLVALALGVWRPGQ
jgi:hypothetical protein